MAARLLSLRIQGISSYRSERVSFEWVLIWMRRYKYEKIYIYCTLYYFATRLIKKNLRIFCHSTHLPNTLRSFPIFSPIIQIDSPTTRPFIPFFALTLRIERNDRWRELWQCPLRIISIDGYTRRHDPFRDLPCSSQSLQRGRPFKQSSMDVYI